MTREEKIKQATTAYEQSTSFEDFPGDKNRAFAAGAEWADDNRWVKVEDGMTLEGGRYLVWVEQVNDLGIECFFWNCSYTPMHGFTDGVKSYNVTHYQLVEPPKAEQ